MHFPIHLPSLPHCLGHHRRSAFPFLPLLFLIIVIVAQPSVNESVGFWPPYPSKIEIRTSFRLPPATSGSTVRLLFFVAYALYLTKLHRSVNMCGLRHPPAIKGAFPTACGRRATDYSFPPPARCFLTIRTSTSRGQ